MDEFHYKVLQALEESPDISQRELARKIGFSLGKTNYCLKALVEKGLVKVAVFTQSRNKGAYAYLLTPSGIDVRLQAASYFLKRKMDEYEALKKEIEQLRRDVKSRSLEKRRSGIASS